MKKTIKKNIKKKSKGFTLIELLAVIVILGILIAISVPAISSILNNARSNTFKNSVESAIKAVANDMEINNPNGGVYHLNSNGYLTAPGETVNLLTKPMIKSPFGGTWSPSSYIKITDDNYEICFDDGKKVLQSTSEDISEIIISNYSGTNSCETMLSTNLYSSTNIMTFNSRCTIGNANNREDCEKTGEWDFDEDENDFCANKLEALTEEECINKGVWVTEPSIVITSIPEGIVQDGVINIPEIIDGKKVVQLGNGNNISLPINATRINIANNVKIIASNAFSNITALKTIQIGTGVTFIGARAFFDPYDLATPTSKLVINNYSSIRTGWQQIFGIAITNDMTMMSQRVTINNL